MKIPTIELTIEDESKEGIFAISLVENPAIEENWVYLSSENIELKVIDEERRVVVGFILVPNKEIYRKQKVGNEVKEFNIKFSKQTVAKAGELFMKNLNNNKATIEHERPVQGVSVIELWTVEDPEHDKSNIYNLKPKGGELVAMSKIYNDEVWQGVKDGKYKAFSIEALFNGFEQLMSLQEPSIIEQLEEIVKNATAQK